MPFDIFRCEALGSVMWLCTADDLDAARAKVAELMRNSPGEFLIANVATGKTFRIRPGDTLAQSQEPEAQSSS